MKQNASLPKRNDYLETLKNVRKNGLYPLHMPGHKRNPRYGNELPYGLDVTEIEGTWDLHHPDAALRARLQEEATAVGAAASFYTVQGSTGGNLAGVYTLCPPGSTILLSRASHQSLYHTVELLHLKPVYLMPDLVPPGIPGPIRPEQVQAALEAFPGIKTVLLTSPTFEGRRCDIRAIADLCHSNGAKLMVDQAHGAHLRYLADFLPHFSDAVADGADLVVESLHKTLPALTPAALVHAADTVDCTELARAISIFETSSPSHLLLASIDHCLRVLEKEGASRHQEVLEAWRSAAKDLDALNVLEWMDFDAPSSLPSDPFRVVLSTAQASISGPELANRLREKGFEPEMAQAEHVLLLLTIGDDPAVFPTLVEAILEIDAQLTKTPKKRPVSTLPSLPVQVLSIAQARRAPKSDVLLSDTAGYVAAEALWTYPPGIPLLMPGEQIRQNTLNALQGMASRGVRLRTDRRPEGVPFDSLSLFVVGAELAESIPSEEVDASSART